MTDNRATPATRRDEVTDGDVDRWRQERVVIHCDPTTGEQFRERDAWAHPDAPGLAINPEECFGEQSSSWYVITHIRSGMRLGDNHKLEDARRRVLMLAQLRGGWDFEASEVLGLPAAFREAAAMIARGPLPEKARTKSTGRPHALEKTSD